MRVSLTQSPSAMTGWTGLGSAKVLLRVNLILLLEDLSMLFMDSPRPHGGVMS